MKLKPCRFCGNRNVETSKSDGHLVFCCGVIFQNVESDDQAIERWNSRPKRGFGTVMVSFQPRFATLVEAGTKVQTVRKIRKRPFKVGQRFIAFEWLGAAYRSNVRTFLESIITEVLPITIDGFIITLNGLVLTPPERDTFAQADGFADMRAMCAWFEATHPMPFEGVCVKWKPTVGKLSD